MMVYLTKECFSTIIYNKLKNKKFGPDEILKNINDNSHDVKLRNDMAISPIFNVAILFKYHSLKEAVYP